MNKSILLTVFSVSFLFLGAINVAACSCEGRSHGVKGLQTCGYYWRTEDVFIGHADSVEIDKKTGTMKVSFSVEKAIRGTPEKTVEIYTGGSEGSCGYPFKQGERYFVYGQKDGQGKYRESLCGPTTLLKDAEDDLAYAKDIEDGKLGTRIWGKVFEDWQPTSKDPRKSVPVPGIEITIKNSKYSFTTVTDENGSYLFKDVPRGPYDLVSNGVPVSDKSKDTDRVNFSGYFGGYQVFAKLPKGYRELFTRQDLTEHFAGGCSGDYFRVTRQGSIRGKVVNFPSREIQNPWNKDTVQQPRVTLMPLDESGQPFKYYAFEEKWAYRDKFEYFFDNVPAGRYLLAINPNNCPYPNNGIPPMFYPGVANQSEAQIIDIREGEQLELKDLRSLSLLKERWIAGRVVDSAGMPVATAGVRLMSGAPGGGPCGSQDFKAQADQLGQFRIRGYETYSYSIQAFTEASSGKAKAYSKIQPVPQGSGNGKLELILDQSL